MGRLGVILGSSAAALGGGALAEVAEAAGAVVIQRHGDGEFRLPHAIDHAGNLRRLHDAGCDRVLGIGSVGSLKKAIEVGALVCPDDFISLQACVTTFEDARAHITPGFDIDWRARVLAAAGGLAVRDGGVYWQAIGPRFETPAEIRLMAAHADVVGMTVASECVIARELGLRYAALCAVDNMANGIGSELSVEELERDRHANVARLHAALEAIVPRLAA
jgi:5'-methylthioadenosine phosphorylase